MFSRCKGHLFLQVFWSQLDPLCPGCKTFWWTLMFSKEKRPHLDRIGHGGRLAQGRVAVWEDTSFGLWTPPWRHPISVSWLRSNNSSRKAFASAQVYSMSAGAVSWQYDVDWGANQHAGLIAGLCDWPPRLYIRLVFFWKALQHRPQPKLTHWRLFFRAYTNYY